MKHVSVGWFEIPVTDMERSKKFYQQVFQLMIPSVLQVAFIDTHGILRTNIHFRHIFAIIHNYSVKEIE